MNGVHCGDPNHLLQVGKAKALAAALLIQHTLFYRSSLSISSTKRLLSGPGRVVSSALLIST